jgi:hypothetical protein
MIVKSGLEFFILKLRKPLQRYLLTARPIQPSWADLFALGNSNFEGAL